MDNVGGVDQPKRVVGIFYVLAAIALGIFLEKVLELALGYAGVNDFAVFSDWTLSTVTGFALAIATAVVVWRIPKTQQVSLEVALELRRVTWPSMRETRAATVAVIVASAVAAVILGLFDLVWSWLSSKIY
ncbi:preprotein translocase, SecE subunit [Anaeromyxobacter dehalogenans 2CP-1]|uniref:Protein translocase subunit SecE n=1 Tax=Anaeromyxobacter dehalogenans (strain ATCC BAA-258 / DSM 21875 / 2CP-1) TaxID=455488 RepID=B8JB76_ANAD2|nr:preprotein translocase subunit SecE [Anaeromyxobacter dehalogenans]ACL65703.1 preprotein translocase, SecE subunit [Anaeromyxobacter dehalogenans 2CP-1]